MSVKRVAIVLTSLLTVALVVFALAHLGAPKAHANQSFHNNHILLPPGGPFTLHAYDPVTNPGGFCIGFDVLVSPIPNLNDAILTQTTLPDGTIVLNIRGPFVVDLTNQVTGKTVRVSLSGPATLTFPPDGSSEFDGNGVTGFFESRPIAASFGIPAIAVFAGPFTSVNAPDGTLTSITYTGRVTDECAALA